MKKRRLEDGDFSRFEVMWVSLTGFWYALVGLTLFLLLLSLSGLEALWSRISGKPMKNFDPWE